MCGSDLWRPTVRTCVRYIGARGVSHYLGLEGWQWYTRQKARMSYAARCVLP